MEPRKNIALRDAITATLLFFDIFEYALTEEELVRYLLWRKTSSSELRRTLRKDPVLRRMVEDQNGLYYMRGRAELVHKRSQYEETSRKRWIWAERVASLLRMVPYSRMIAVTGSLARNASAEKSDIDFLVVTKSGRIWSCRLMMALLSRIVKIGARNRPRVCLNFFVTEESLRLLRFQMSPDDIWLPVWISQVAPIYCSDLDFFCHNTWIESYLPNWSPDIGRSRSLSRSILEGLLDNQIGELFETYCRRRYARKNDASREAQKHKKGYFFNDRYIKIHLNDKRPRFLREFTERLKEYGIRLA